MGGCLSRTSEVTEQEVMAVTPRRRSSRTGGRSGNRSNRGQSYVVRTYTPPPPPPIFGCEGEYKVMELLGTGGTGQTWLCQHHETARRVAIKFVPRPLPPVLVPLISMELQLQASLSEGHLGLVRLESAMLSRTHLGLVMEYVDGGTLTQYVSKRTETRDERAGLNLTEDEARYMFRQLVFAVNHLHNSHVAHRDLKMCNVVLSSTYPPALKLCDFGFAKNFNNEDSKMHTCIGTPVYMSPNQLAAAAATKKAPPPPTPFPGKTMELPPPEPAPATQPQPQPQADASAAPGDLSDATPVLSYSARAADVWACGVMLFAMLLGRFPFDHENHPDPNSSDAQVEVWKEQVRASGEDWQKMPRVAPYVRLLSDSCRDLLGKMLQFEEADRINVSGILQHPWFNQPLPEHLAKTLTELEGRQERQHQRLAKVAPEQVAARDAAIKELVLRASRVPGQRANGGAGGTRRPPPLSILNPGLFAAIQEADRESDSPRTPGRGTPAGDGSQTPRRVTFAQSSAPDSERPTGPPCSEAPVSSMQVQVGVEGGSNAASHEGSDKGDAKADAGEGDAQPDPLADDGKLFLLDLSSAAWAAKQIESPEPAPAPPADAVQDGAGEGAGPSSASMAGTPEAAAAVTSVAGAVAEAAIAQAGASHAPSSTACGSPPAASLAVSTATSLLTNHSSATLCAPAVSCSANAVHDATVSELAAAVDAAVAAVAAAAEKEAVHNACGRKVEELSIEPAKAALSNGDGRASGGSAQAPCTPDNTLGAAVTVSA
ncbi:hypothetical protein HXX76_005718 [Chlamydomonas incerta]|uniref:Protein kinase domain-containing protein n=1 Tax=Chlamydomonas incerta TaxID=51695 RepID=A0A835TD13_CHLIN|nr:hypothetical protein HXX76_005718 [Chlamydomonas incerta]|eukprot:KAG2438109.1 hypothetical protein HXX76_005718 [Chlamydomonas incerta]